MKRCIICESFERCGMAKQGYEWCTSFVVDASYGSVQKVKRNLDR